MNKSNHEIYNPYDSEIYSTRQSAAINALKQGNLTTLALNAGPSLFYFTGLHFHLSERPVIFFLSTEGIPVLVIPELEMRKAETITQTVKVLTYGEPPDTWLSSFSQALDALSPKNHPLAVEPTRFRFLEYSLLTQADPGLKIMSGEKVIAALRMIKDTSEISAMRQAVTIAQQAFIRTLPFIQVGRTEREIAAELTQKLLQFDSDPEIPFSPIVSAGENSANPHATPTDREICEGDLLVIDWGAAYRGYISDLTRTIVIGEVEPELKTIAEVVCAANERARKESKPGITASEIDFAARQTINEVGYGEYFTHRTGHGIGLEGHEPPYIRSDNRLIIQQGMTFTIEPGIYLPGRGGVRIEDNIVITESGVECLSDLPRQLISL